MGRLTYLDPRGPSAKRCHASRLTVVKGMKKREVRLTSNRLKEGVRISRGGGISRRESEPRGHRTMLCRDPPCAS